MFSHACDVYLQRHEKHNYSGANRSDPSNEKKVLWETKIAMLVELGDGR